MTLLLAGLIGALVGAGAVVALTRRPAPRTGTRVSGDEHTERLIDAGRHVAAVAHELSNPLGAILAFAQDLLQADPTPEQRDALQVIQQQARRSRRIVRGLLETVRAPADTGEQLDPSELLARVALVFQRECAARSQHFELDAAPDLPPVPGDAVGLEQVLTNLLQNACQATPAGGRVMLTAVIRGRLLELTVQDTGPGIPPEAMDRIFEPFFTTKSSGEGTGLGLSVAQGIVRRHRGVLRVENVPAVDGGGSRFIVALPFADRRRADREPVGDEGIPPAPRPGLRVLLVENEEGLRTAVKRYLERLGWSVETAEDGESALARVREAPPAVLVSDIRLDGMDGMTLHERLGAVHRDLATRMVFISGDPTAADVRRFVERTGAPILGKPFELRRLAEVLAAMAAT